jgi:hypothetical protein
MVSTHNKMAEVDTEPSSDYYDKHFYRKGRWQKRYCKYFACLSLISAMLMLSCLPDLLFLSGNFTIWSANWFCMLSCVYWLKQTNQKAVTYFASLVVFLLTSLT